MHRLFLIISRSFTSLLLVMSILLPAALNAQNQHPIATWLNEYRNAAGFLPVNVLSLNSDRSDLQGVVANAVILRANDEAVDQILHNAPPTMVFSIPQHNGGVLNLELAKVEILAPDFSVGVLGDHAQERFPFHPAVHYRGIVQGNDASVACLSITSNGLSGMIADEQGTRELGMLEDGSENYVFYKTSDLNASSPNSCFADDNSLQGDFGGEVSAEDRGIGCKTVSIYFECDYKLYTDKGSSVTTVTNYVTSLFNQIATLYANENVGVSISEIFVWTSPDPYTSQTSIAGLLNAFRQTKAGNFNGQLAHFLTTRSLGGGIAYVDVICFKQYAYGVSCINTTYQNVPTYSWSVEVTTHELGHNLGSWHTQSCNWPVGPLDNCVSPEGSCTPGPAPTNGGTIMSYCHLTGYGINFNNGFGQYPGAKIRDKVLNAACLSSSGTAPSGLTTSNISNASATLNWAPVAGTATYTIQYKANTSSTWINAGNTTAALFNLTGLAANTSYNWQVKTDCSNFSTTATFTTTSSGGGSGCAIPSGLIATNITSNAAILSWAAVLGASSYTVQYKTAGASTWLTAGTSNTSAYNLSGLSSSTSYNWKVKANCSDFSPVSSFATGSSGGGGSCATPTGLTNVSVQSTAASISWTPVSGATNYTLQLKLASSSTYFTLGPLNGTAVTINGLQPSTTYNWRVKANCSTYSIEKILTTPANLQGTGSDNQTFEQPYVVEADENTMLVYPNPAKDFVWLKHSQAVDVETYVVVSNATGNVVWEQTIKAETNGIDISTFPSGVYFFSIRQNKRHVTTQRVVVLR